MSNFIRGYTVCDFIKIICWTTRFVQTLRVHLFQGGMVNSAFNVKGDGYAFRRREVTVRIVFLPIRKGVHSEKNEFLHLGYKFLPFSVEAPSRGPWGIE